MTRRLLAGVLPAYCWAGQYEVGAQVTVTAAPTSDSVFRNWTVDGAVVSTEASYTFTVATDQVLTANFTAQ